MLEATRHLQIKTKEKKILREGTKKEINPLFLVNIVINFTDKSGPSRPVCHNLLKWPSCSPKSDLPHHPQEDQANQHTLEELVTLKLCTDDPDYMR